MQILRELYYDLQDRGGLDFEAAVEIGLLGLGYANGEVQFKYPPVLQDTWQLKTALIFLAVGKERAKVILKERHLV